MVELPTAPQLKIHKEVHPRKLRLIKQKVSQDTIDELSSEDEENICAEKEKQDSDSGSEDLEPPTTSKRQKTNSSINLVTAVKLSTRFFWKDLSLFCTILSRRRNLALYLIVGHTNHIILI